MAAQAKAPQPKASQPKAAQPKAAHPNIVQPKVAQTKETQPIEITSEQKAAAIVVSLGVDKASEIYKFLSTHLVFILKFINAAFAPV